MKTEPTDIDREAAALFVPAPGMRVFMTRARWLETGRIIVSNDAEHWAVCESNVNVLLSMRPDAFDTDDPATVGVLLAQVEAAYAEDLHVVWIRFPTEGDAGWVVQPADWSMSLDGIGFDLTRGAALVAAMRGMKADPTR